MPTGKYTMSDVAAVAPPIGKYTAADLAPSSAPPPPQQGFFSSFGDQNGIVQGLKQVGSAIMHHGDTLSNLAGAVDIRNPHGPLVDAISGEYNRIKGEAGQVIQAQKDNNLAAGISHGISMIPVIGPGMDKAVDQYADKNYSGEMGTLAGMVSNLQLPKTKAAVTSAADIARDIPDTYRAARAGVVGGSKLDQVIPGDTVTPRQQYNIAKSQGVNLDTAQATNAPIPTQIKRVTEHSLGGSSKFEANNADNVQALHGHAQGILDAAHPDAMSREEFGLAVKDALLEHKDVLEKQAGLPEKATAILDSATPDSMSREDFGNTVQESLRNHQTLLNDQASALFKDLDSKVGNTLPDMQAVRTQAQGIIKDNKNYYANHPELLSGAPGRAWSIVKSLADTSSEAPKLDTWSDLHKMRSDLMNMYRSPDIVGSNAEGWLKQLTGKVDESMTGAASGLSDADEAKFREANKIYSGMKQTYDNPQNPLYHIVRAQDGSTAANSLSNISPQIAKQIRQAGSDLETPELNQHLQRQTIDRLMDPVGNGTPDLAGLPDRFAKAQKERLGGVLSPRQMSDLHDLIREIQTPGPYDNPRSDVHKIINSKDGLTAAISALDAGPEGIAQITKAAQAIGSKDVIPQLQRQAMSRLLSPPGNDLPDLKNLPSRFTRAQKEKLSSVLTPGQTQSLDDLSRTSRMVNFDANPAGSGKLVQKQSEASALGVGVLGGITGVATGNPALALSSATPLAYAGAQRFISSKMTNRAFTESIMNPPLTGKALWANQGVVKLLDHIGSDPAATLTRSDIEALGKTPQGKSLLVRASGLTPGSPAMKALIKSIKP
jgi:hypothetical protein